MEDVYKDPTTDPDKASKRGRLKLVRAEDGGFETRAETASGQDELVPLFRDPDLLVEHDFEAIRQRAGL